MANSSAINAVICSINCTFLLFSSPVPSPRDNKQSNWKIKVSFNELFNAVSMGERRNERNQFVNRFGCAHCAFLFSTLRWKPTHTNARTHTKCECWENERKKEKKSFSFVRSLFIKWYYSSSLQRRQPPTCNKYISVFATRTHTPFASISGRPSSLSRCPSRRLIVIFVMIYFTFFDVCAHCTGTRHSTALKLKANIYAMPHVYSRNHLLALFG